MDSPTPQNIVLVTTELRPGGAEKCLVKLACGLNRDLFRPLVVSVASRPSNAESKLIDQLARAEVPVHFLNCDSKLSIWSAIRRLRKKVQEFEADIVQSFLIHANVVSGLALRRLPNVAFYTGIRVADPSRFRHRVERWATSRARKIICVSESVRNFAAAEMGFDISKLISISNSVDPPSFNASFDASDESIQKPYVVFVGRLEPQKGLVPFLQAFARHDADLPNFDLVFVGDGSEAKVIQAETRSLDRKVHLVGWKENPIDYLAHSAIKILPSKWEGMPNVLLEAMSLGKPFVAFAVDGVAELCPASSPQLISPGNYDSFFAAMTQLLTDKALAEKTGSENLRYAQKNFSTEKMIAKYEAVYLGDATNPS